MAPRPPVGMKANPLLAPDGEGVAPEVKMVFAAKSVIAPPPSKEEVESGMPHMVDEQFTVMWPATHTYKQGMIITDVQEIRRLKSAGAPISVVKNLESLVTCPNCRHVHRPPVVK